ncbi:hypothetical protein GUY44_07125 [Pimelobacter simplex]|uniref:Uncharacterized protein n=1 Tax=Nocardioides simplex TaxID=2045 RepID=A0A0A1DQV9_NOCSI|nr:hypothetical protein [Pimelobacter simplex]AIY17780.1 hypothetical protein KR76_15230 [Pimelobacter simplex]MCG8150244.1 hypothetical protein [Pimelobacter simplex]GEB13546.1 hypothetical protein NSI01_18610 [Pimelobacter simplex]SFM71882.1 hypothetical protein SAMN05421671_3125 [Pimelobacter simplex]
MAIDYSSKVGKVRLLINDVDEGNLVFPDDQLEAFLALEHDSVKRAAAQAIDSQATNEALALKVLKDHQVQTDGAKLADAMRRHADSLRKQAREDEDAEDDGFYFDVIDIVGGNGSHPELTERPL